MKIQLWSKWSAGKWAAILTLIFIVLMSLKLSTFAMLIRLPLPTPLIAVFGVVGFIMGVISIIKNKDIAFYDLVINSSRTADHFLDSGRNSVSSLVGILCQVKLQKTEYLKYQT